MNSSNRSIVVAENLRRQWAITLGRKTSVDNGRYSFDDQLVFGKNLRSKKHSTINSSTGKHPKRKKQTYIHII